jgi:Tetracyclin repressor-like, C-terminal domain
VLTDGPPSSDGRSGDVIDGQYSLGLVRVALEVNIQVGNLAPQPIEPLTHLVVGAINEAALAVAAAPNVDQPRVEFTASIERVLEALRAAARPVGGSAPPT